MTLLNMQTTSPLSILIHKDVHFFRMNTTFISSTFVSFSEVKKYISMNEMHDLSLHEMTKRATWI